MKRHVVVGLGLLFVLGGCKKLIGGGSSDFDPNTPLETVKESLSAGGKPALAFSVQVPKGLAKKADKGPAAGAMADYEDPKAIFSPIRVHLYMTSSPSSLKDAVKLFEISDTVKTQKELNPSDPVPDWNASAVSKTGSSYTAKSVRRTGTAAIECTATYIGSSAKEPEKMLALMESICNSVKPDVPGITPEQAAAEKAKLSPPAAPVEPEVTAFLATLNGKSSSVAAGLKKYGVPKLNTGDMEMFNLSEPKIMKSAKVGSQTCHDVYASSGMTKRGYTLCFDKGKLQKVTPLGANGLLPPGT